MDKHLLLAARANMYSLSVTTLISEYIKGFALDGTYDGRDLRLVIEQHAKLSRALIELQKHHDESFVSNPPA